MDPQIGQRLDQLEQKIDHIFKSVESTRKYLKWTMIITVAFLVLPLLGSIFIIPFFLNTMSSVYSF